MTQQARFSQSRNDMYWSIYDECDGFVRWAGYDDEYWWDNVATTEQARVRIGKSGRRYTIDFSTGAVSVDHTGAE